VRTIIVLLLVWNAACEQCTEGESECSADGIAVCNYGRLEISFCCAQDGCREVDVDGTRRAVCSPSDEPDPRCASAEPIDNICADARTALHCDSGYGGHERQCDGVCVSPKPHTALCAVSNAPDARCADGRTTDHCSGSAIVSCSMGYATREQQCAAPFDTCVMVPNNLGGLEPRCATSQPDAACATDSPGRCDGLDIYGCRAGRRTFEHCEHSCYQNPADSMFPEAFCEGPHCDIGG
jgi:hypothetical protein